MFNLTDKNEIIPSLVYTDNKLIVNRFSKYSLDGIIYMDFLEEIETAINNSPHTVSLVEDDVYNNNLKHYTLKVGNSIRDGGIYQGIKCIIKGNKVYLFKKDIWWLLHEDSIQQTLNFLNNSLSGLTQLDEVKWVLSKMGITLEDYNSSRTLFKFITKGSTISLVLQYTDYGFVVKHFLSEYTLNNTKTTFKCSKPVKDVWGYNRTKVGVSSITGTAVVSQSLRGIKGHLLITDTNLPSPLSVYELLSISNKPILNDNKTLTLFIQDKTFTVSLITK